MQVGTKKILTMFSNMYEAYFLLISTTPYAVPNPILTIPLTREDATTDALRFLFSRDDCTKGLLTIVLENLN
jgi:hypothetical protein